MNGSDPSAISPRSAEQRELYRMMVAALKYAHGCNMSVYTIEGLWLHAWEHVR